MNIQKRYRQSHLGPDYHHEKGNLARALRGELETNDPAEESAVELLKTVL